MNPFIFALGTRERLHGHLREDLSQNCLIYSSVIVTDRPVYFNPCIDQTSTDVYTGCLSMKKDLHPDNYRTVVFKDLNNGTTFLTRSTVASEETIKWEDGNEYPLVTVHISSASHPFFTGEERIVDIEGRVDKFKARQEAAAKRREAAKAKKPRAKKESKDEIQKIGDKKPSR